MVRGQCRRAARRRFRGARTCDRPLASAPRRASSRADERETTGKRALLNLGHTFGHALEAETGFSDKLLHGEGVAAGMALAFAYSAPARPVPRRRTPNASPRICAAIGLPDGLAGRRHHRQRRAARRSTCSTTKKMSAGTLPFLLARGIGQTFLDKDGWRSGPKWRRFDAQER